MLDRLRGLFLKDPKNISGISNMEMEHLFDNKHSIGSVEDIMEILHITKKESMMNTLERIHIFNETRLDNQINDNYTVNYNAIFHAIIHKNTQRAFTTVTPCSVTNCYSGRTHA